MYVWTDQDAKGFIEANVPYKACNVSRMYDDGVQYFSFYLPKFAAAIGREGDEKCLCRGSLSGPKGCSHLDGRRWKIAERVPALPLVPHSAPHVAQ